MAHAYLNPLIRPQIAPAFGGELEHGSQAKNRRPIVLLGGVTVNRDVGLSRKKGYNCGQQTAQTGSPPGKPKL